MFVGCHSARQKSPHRWGANWRYSRRVLVLRRLQVPLADQAGEETIIVRTPMPHMVAVSPFASASAERQFAQISLRFRPIPLHSHATPGVGGRTVRWPVPVRKRACLECNCRACGPAEDSDAQVVDRLRERVVPASASCQALALHAWPRVHAKWSIFLHLC